MEKFSFVFILFATIISIDTMAFDYFHCKAATCHEFYYGLKKFPQQKDYVNLCYDTVHSLQMISNKYGKCFNVLTNKLNPACIYALASTMRNCVNGLKDLPVFYGKYYCGYRLMKNCAKHIGLEQFPYHTDYEQTKHDEFN